MPLVLLPERYDRWLDPRASVPNLLALLTPLPANLLEVVKAGPAVNKVAAIRYEMPWSGEGLAVSVYLDAERRVVCAEGYDWSGGSHLDRLRGWLGLSPIPARGREEGHFPAGTTRHPSTPPRTSTARSGRR